jgi:hypothetical protein
MRDKMSSDQDSRHATKTPVDTIRQILETKMAEVTEDFLEEAQAVSSKAVRYRGGTTGYKATHLIAALNEPSAHTL